MKDFHDGVRMSVSPAVRESGFNDTYILTS